MPEIIVLQFLRYFVNMRLRTPVPLDHIFHQIQEHLHDIRRVGKARRDPAAFNNEIAQDINKNSLRPGRILTLLPVRCDNIESASIENRLLLGR